MKRLKPVLVSTVAASALVATPALAQAPLFNWTGFYAGANVGGAWGRSSYAETATGFYAAPPNRNSPAGVIGGVQAGYNWQANNVVFGVEADIDLSSASESSAIGALGVVHRSELRALATLRGRAGIVMGQTLAYVTGGAAHGWLKNEIVDPANVLVVDRGSAWGWAGGGGFEHAFANNWTAKVEFLHAQFSGKTLSSTGYTFRFKDSYSVARVGINYRF